MCYDDNHKGLSLRGRSIYSGCPCWGVLRRQPRGIAVPSGGRYAAAQDAAGECIDTCYDDNHKRH
ncbi:MAG: hypothetical protein PVS3B1_03020 [Ktedonobacteraceae bacterium]